MSALLKPSRRSAEDNASNGESDASPPPSPPLGRLSNVGEFEKLYDTVQAGCDAFYDVCRQLPYGDSDRDLNLITNNLNESIRRVFNAIVCYKRTSTEQEEMAHDLSLTFDTLGEKVAYLEQVAHLVVDCVVQLHDKGDHLKPWQVKRMMPTEGDEQMTAPQRLEFITTALMRTKSLCEKLFSGKDWITQFVRAPEALEKLEWANKTLPEWWKDKPSQPEAEDAELPSPSPKEPDFSHLSSLPTAQSAKPNAVSGAHPQQRASKSLSASEIRRGSNDNAEGSSIDVGMGDGEDSEQDAEHESVSDADGMLWAKE